MHNSMLLDTSRAVTLIPFFSVGEALASRADHVLELVWDPASAGKPKELRLARDGTAFPHVRIQTDHYSSCPNDLFPFGLVAQFWHMHIELLLDVFSM